MSVSHWEGLLWGLASFTEVCFYCYRFRSSLLLPVALSKVIHPGALTSLSKQPGGVTVFGSSPTLRAFSSRRLTVRQR